MPQLSNQKRQRFSDALARLGGDEETFVMLAEIVAEDAPSILGKLESDVQSADMAEAARSAHTLKGLLSTFETGPPVSDLQPLIDAARANQAAETKRLMEQSQRLLHRLIKSVSEIAAD